jgi:ribosomal protein S18 acetylase RimI-like enzyme
LNDVPVEFRRGEYLISTDRGRIAPEAALALLRSTFWGAGMDLDVLSRAITNSVCFGLYRGEDLIGFGRVVTDLATYAYWTDVVVADGHRGKGLGQWLSECMLRHPELQRFRRVALLTRDAQALYERVGFTVGPESLIYMEHRG